MPTLRSSRERTKHSTIGHVDARYTRTHLSELMTEAEKDNTRFLVSRGGKPRMIVMSVEDYLKDLLQKDALLTEIQSNAQKAGLNKLSQEEIEAEIEAYRRSGKEN